MDSSIIHLLLEILAWSLLIYIWYISYKLYSLLSYEGLRFLSLCWLLVWSLDLAHALLAISGVVTDLAFFIPSTWLLWKILFSLILIMVLVPPKHITLIRSFGIGAVIGTFALMIPYSGVYYMDDWVMGRPAEWVPFIISIFGLYIYCCSKKTNLSNYIWLALMITLITQVTMVYSHGLFDTLFTIAHVTQVLSIIPLLFYINKKLN